MKYKKTNYNVFVKKVIVLKPKNSMDVAKQKIIEEMKYYTDLWNSIYEGQQPPKIFTK